MAKKEVVYGNKDVLAAAKSRKNKPGAIMKEVGGAVVGKKSGGRLDKPGRSPFSKAAGGATK